MAEQYVVIQKRHKYRGGRPPSGPMSVERLDRVTEKCVFVRYGNVMTSRHHRDEVLFKVFDSREEAQSFVDRAKISADLPRLLVAQEKLRNELADLRTDVLKAWTQAGREAFDLEADDG